MRFRLLADYFLIFLATSSFAQSQPTTFQHQAQMAVSAGKPFNTVNLSATAEWTAGADHESGTAQLQANVNGSTNVQLSLGKASRTEVQTGIGPSRACNWIDSAGKSRDILGSNCLIAIPWFSPGLFTQPNGNLPALLSITDDGMVMKDGSTFHQVSYLLNLTSADISSTNQMVSQSKVNVFYDPQTFLPTSLEYFIHPDGNDLQNIPVRVVFSNYQSVSGVTLPFQIEKYVNRTLQLKLNVSTATIE
jgi:hypothetical protein